MIQLSIIVAIYNTEKFLIRCLDNLLQQGLSPHEYEIIVINDSCPNNSGEIIKSYISKHSHISFIEPENQEIGETRNIGITLARGKYIYFMDSDDYICNDVMGDIVSFMDKEELDIFGFGITNTTRSSIPTPLIKENLKDITVYEGKTYISQFNFSSESVWLVINLEFLRSNNIRFAPDAGFPKGVFTVQLLYHAKRMVVIPDIIYADFQYPNSELYRSGEEQIGILLEKYESTSDEYTKFLRRVELENEINANGLERIRSKSISYIFFMLIKAVKSALTIKEIRQIIRRLRFKNYYPIKGFMGSDYRNNSTRLWLFTINNEILFLLFIPTFRLLSPLLQRFK